ncbi:Potassium/sodium hyperpolarization-activated cyclic nucleotide-gated channel 4, partial [Rhizoclosmatium sp. JEL0117]
KVAFLRRLENDGRDEIFFSAIASKLHACYYTPGDFITKQGESAADMYFIVSGKCDVYVGDKKVVSLYDGAYFGGNEISCTLSTNFKAQKIEVALICKVLRTASVQAIMHSVLYRLTFQDFHDILEEFQDMKDRIQALAAEREIAAQVPPAPAPVILKSTVFAEEPAVKDVSDVFG